VLSIREWAVAGAAVDAHSLQPEAADLRKRIGRVAIKDHVLMRMVTRSDADRPDRPGVVPPVPGPSAERARLCR